MKITIELDGKVYASVAENSEATCDGCVWDRHEQCGFVQDLCSSYNLIFIQK